jgi:hypothetical protein
MRSPYGVAGRIILWIGAFIVVFLILDALNIIQ